MKINHARLTHITIAVHIARRSVDDLLDELARHADAVLRLEARAAEHRAAIRELLPKARAASSRNGPSRLERVIKSVYVRETISQWTKDVAVPEGVRGRKPAVSRKAAA
jgi:hypothetical protein